MALALAVASKPPASVAASSQGSGMPRAAMTIVSAVIASSRVVTCGLTRLTYARRTPPKRRDSRGEASAGTSHCVPEFILSSIHARCVSIRTASRTGTCRTRRSADGRRRRLARQQELHNGVQVCVRHFGPELRHVGSTVRDARDHLAIGKSIADVREVRSTLPADAVDRVAGDAQVVMKELCPAFLCHRETGIVLGLHGWHKPTNRIEVRFPG